MLNVLHACTAINFTMFLMPYVYECEEITVLYFYRSIDKIDKMVLAREEKKIQAFFPATYSLFYTRTQLVKYLYKLFSTIHLHAEYIYI